jgi:hypothetical protein
VVLCETNILSLINQYLDNYYQIKTKLLQCEGHLLCKVWTPNLGSKQGPSAVVQSAQEPLPGFRARVCDAGRAPAYRHCRHIHRTAQLAVAVITVRTCMFRHFNVMEIFFLHGNLVANLETKQPLAPSKFQKFYKIPRHIESLDACMQH